MCLLSPRTVNRVCPDQCRSVTLCLFRGKLRELKKTGDAFELRAKELKALPKATKNAQDFLKVARQAVGGWATTKPWLNATEVDTLKQEVQLLPVLR